MIWAIVLQFSFIFSTFDYMYQDAWFMMQDLGLSHLYSLYSLLVFLFRHGLVVLFSQSENGL